MVMSVLLVRIHARGRGIWTVSPPTRHRPVSLPVSLCRCVGKCVIPVPRLFALKMSRYVSRVTTVLTLALAGSVARAQSVPPSSPAPSHASVSSPALPGTVNATMSTQGGTVLLPGVLVLLQMASGEPVAEEVSDGDGQVVISGLAPGIYHLNATLDGFDPADRVVT